MGPSAAELCVKHIGIVLTAYVILLNSLGDDRSFRAFSRQAIYGGAAAVLIGTVTGCLYNTIPLGCILLMLLLFYLIIGAVMKINKRKMLLITIVSFALSYLLSFFATVIFLIVLYLHKVVVSGRFDRNVDAWIYVLHFVTNFWGGIIVRSFILAVQLLFLALMMRIKKIKDGLRGLRKVDRNDLTVFLCVVALSLRALHITSVFQRTDVGAVKIIGFFIIILLFFVFFFWLKKEHRLVYNIHLQENELRLMEKSLDSKQGYYKQILAVNENFGSLIHRDNKLIPSVVMSVRHSVENSAGSVDGSSAAEAANSLDEIAVERNAALSGYEACGSRLPCTGVTAIDAVLLYLTDQASAKGIEMNVEITARPESIPSNPPERCEFIAVLADLCEYSASTSGIGKCVADVTVGQDDGRLFIEVSDNGKQFNMKELKKTGRKRRNSSDAGSHEKDYPVPLFWILRHSGAILSVNEFPENKKYTRSLRVTFPSYKEQ